MRKHSIMAVLLSILTLAIFAGCNSSSDSSFTPVNPVLPPTDTTEVGTYDIISIKATTGVTNPYNGANIQQILDYKGGMVVTSAKAIRGKYQILGYAELADRPATPKEKLVTYNEFKVDTLAAASFTKVADKTYSLTVVDNAGITLELQVKKNSDFVDPLLYLDWALDGNNDPLGNPYWKNFSFYTPQSRTLIPTNLIGNYIITSASIDKTGTPLDVVSSLADKKLVGELFVTAAQVGMEVKLKIVLKMQIDQVLADTIGFKAYNYATITDTIPLDFPLGELMKRLPAIFASEGMVIVPDTEANITYTPKKRTTPGGSVFEDVLIDGAKVKLNLTKIINGQLIVGSDTAVPKRVLEDAKYWN